MSTDQSVQTYFTVFSFCQTLILTYLFKENISGKITCYSAQFDYFSGAFFSILSLLTLLPG